jgi:hypothetical protein
LEIEYVGELKYTQFFEDHDESRSMVLAVLQRPGGRPRALSSPSLATAGEKS